MAEISSFRLFDFKPSKEMLQKRYREVVEKARQNPKNGELWMSAGHAAAAVEDYHQAIQHFEAAMALDANLPGLQAALSRARRIYAEKGGTAPPASATAAANESSEIIGSPLPPVAAGAEDRRDPNYVPVWDLSKKPAPPFGDLIAEAFVHPFKSDLFALVLSALFIAGADVLTEHFGVFGLPLWLVVIAYQTAWYVRIIKASATAVDVAIEMPDTHSFGDVWKFVNAAVASFALVLAGGVAAAAMGRAGESLGEAGAVLAFGPGMILMIAGAVLGTLYYPMAILANSIFESSFVGYRYIFLVGSIFRAMPEIILLQVIAFAMWGVLAVAKRFVAPMEHMYVSIPAAIGVTMVAVYLNVVFYRLLGFVYLTKRAKLGWLP